MSYRLRYSDEARRALRTLPGFYRQRAKRVIERLSENPYPSKSKPLPDLPNGHRIRLGSWRIIYQVDPDSDEVYVLAVREKTGPETHEDLDSGQPSP